MPVSHLPLGLPAHPHQLEVQEFDAYGLILDLRSAADSAEDHVPGAVALPWSEPRAEPGAQGHGFERVDSGAPLVAAEPAAELPYALQALLGKLEPGAQVLVYCDRGGLDSAELAIRLQRHGYDADVLPGGWANYRRWVLASIEVLSQVLSFRWVRSPPGGPAQAVVGVLEDQGLQVLSWASLLGPMRLPGLTLPGEVTLSQGWFESLLVDALRRMDPERGVWVDEALLLDSSIELPAALCDAWCHAAAVRLDMALAGRVDVLRAHLDAQQMDATRLIDSLRPVIPARLKSRLEKARTLAVQGKTDEAMATVLADCTDRLYRDQSMPAEAESETRLALTSVAPDAVMAALMALPPPWPELLRDDADQINP